LVNLDSTKIKYYIIIYKIIYKYLNYLVFCILFFSSKEEEEEGDKNAKKRRRRGRRR
jgi:hypothetical protein